MLTRALRHTQANLRVIEPKPESTHMSRQLYSKKETAKALGISVRTIDNLIARKVIPSIRIGSRRLFRIERVIAALESGAAAPSNLS